MKKALSLFTTAVIMLSLFIIPASVNAETKITDLDNIGLSSGPTRVEYTPSLTDSFGNRYQTSMIVDGGYSTSWVEYDVTQFSSFSGTIATPGLGVRSDFRQGVRIYVDDRLEFESREFLGNGSIRPQSFNVDVSSARKVRIEWPGIQSISNIAATLYDGVFILD